MKRGTDRKKMGKKTENKPRDISELEKKTCIKEGGGGSQKKDTPPAKEEHGL